MTFILVCAAVYRAKFKSTWKLKSVFKCICTDAMFLFYFFSLKVFI